MIYEFPLINVAVVIGIHLSRDIMVASYLVKIQSFCGKPLELHNNSIAVSCVDL